MAIKKKLWMNINICHVYSDSQNETTNFDTASQIIRQRVSVLRHNAILQNVRQRHLSYRCFIFETVS